MPTKKHLTTARLPMCRDPCLSHSLILPHLSPSTPPSVWSHLLSLVLHLGCNCWRLVGSFFVLWFVWWDEGWWAPGHLWQCCLERVWSICEFQEFNQCENISILWWNANKLSVLSLVSQVVVFSLLKYRQKMKTHPVCFVSLGRSKGWLS